MRSHPRKVMAAGVGLALLVGLLGTAAAAGRPATPNDQPAFSVWRVLHWVFRGVRGEVRRLGSAVQQLQIEFVDLDTRVDDLEVQKLNQRVEELEQMVLALQFGIDELADLADILPPVEDFNDQLRGCIRIFDGEIAGLPGPHVLFEGCNVHVRSGELATDAPVNGRGNLLVGYNEGQCAGVLSCFEDDDCPGDLVCGGSQGEQCVIPGDPEVLPTDLACLSDAECPGDLECDHLSTRGGSHNLVVGDRHRYTSYGGLVAGRQNLLGAEHASVVGGTENEATGSEASILGGFSNQAGSGSTVSGGSGNSAEAFAASVSGGFSNRAMGQFSSVCGGGENSAASYASSVSGGTGNVSGIPGSFGQDAGYSSISGGRDNVAAGEHSSVSGGRDRSVSGPFDWRAGGQFEDD